VGQSSLDRGLEQLPQSAPDGEILARSDSAGASHALADACRECEIRFSFRYPIGEPVRQALLSLAQSGRRPAIDQDGPGARWGGVAELPGEDPVKTLKATGDGFLPLHSFAANAAWLELALCAHDFMRAFKPLQALPAHG
jgi:hypothetical protein